MLSQYNKQWLARDYSNLLILMNKYALKYNNTLCFQILHSDFKIVVNRTIRFGYDIYSFKSKDNEFQLFVRALSFYSFNLIKSYVLYNGERYNIYRHRNLLKIYFDNNELSISNLFMDDKDFVFLNSNIIGDVSIVKDSYSNKEFLFSFKEDTYAYFYILMYISSIDWVGP